jgi:predicted nucleic-acid-binding protein
LRTVVVDANVLISFFLNRSEAQAAAGEELFQRARAAEVNAIVPQSVVFETAYVLQSFYGVDRERVAAVIRDVVTTPGIRIDDEWPWQRVLDIWPATLPSLADASIVAVAMAKGYDAIATFDRKLSKKLAIFRIESYF